jgi:hypothetical protein
MPSKVRIKESSDEPMPTEQGGEIKKVKRGGTAKASERVINEADTATELPVVQGGKIKKIKRSSKADRHWFDDDKNNPLRVRQWVYEVILGAGLLVIIICFLVVFISSVRQGKLDFQSFLREMGPFLGGLGIGYAVRRRDKRPTRPNDGDEEREKRGGDDTG